MDLRALVEEAVEALNDACNAAESYGASWSGFGARNAELARREAEEKIRAILAAVEGEGGSVVADAESDRAITPGSRPPSSTPASEPENLDAGKVGCDGSGYLSDSAYDPPRECPGCRECDPPASEPGTSSKSTFRTCEPETGEEER